MKKLALTIAIVLGISIFTYAQTEKAGGLFQYGTASEEEEYYGSAWYALDQNNQMNDEGGLFSLLRSGSLGLPGFPDHDQDTNQTAPLGSGALLLIGLGAAYALKKKSKK
jgi:hypothetical protein